MNPTSKRRKSALLQNMVKDKILKAFPHLKKKDVVTANHGQTGPDVVLSKVARKLVGVNFECKNQNKMKTIYEMNTRSPLVVIDLDDFIDLIK